MTSKTEKFKKGMRVMYLPNHANGNKHHEDRQYVVVSSKNDKFVFVKYDCLACQMVTGDEPYTAQATKPENLF